jgi:hypothetical protein
MTNTTDTTRLQRLVERATTPPIDHLFDLAAERFRNAQRSLASEGPEDGDLLARTLRRSIEEAFEAGRIAGIAEELGVLAVIHDEDVPRFPWQVFCRDETCVLVSPDGSDQLVIASGVSDDELWRVSSLIEVPGTVLEAVRRALLR